MCRAKGIKARSNPDIDIKRPVWQGLGNADRHVAIKFGRHAGFTCFACQLIKDRLQDGRQAAIMQNAIPQIRKYVPQPENPT